MEDHFTDNTQIFKTMITKQELVKRIEELLNELTENFKQVSEPGEIDELNYELFEINAVYFAENAKILRKLTAVAKLNETDSVNSSQEEAVETPKEEEKRALDNESQEEKKEALENDLDSPFTPESDSYKPEEGNTEIKPEEHKEEIKHEEKQEEEIKDEEGEREIKPEEREKEVEPEEEKTKEPVSHEIVQEEKAFSFRPDEQEEVKNDVSDKVPVAEEPKKPMSLNERISAQKQTLASTYNKHPESLQRIKDIKSAISLNDKLLFIKDLFNGYSLAYSEAIELLNRFGNFADADQFLKNNYAIKNNWESKKETVSKLYAILRKRYG